MKISDRFTDYGLVGGLFWILQLGFLLFTAAFLWPHRVRAGFLAFVSAPVLAAPGFVAMAGVVGLIIVFATGLLLELMGSSYFRFIEMIVFVKHSRQHEHWLRMFVASNKTYIQDDVSLLLNSPNMLSKEHFVTSMRVFMIWNKSYRQAYKTLFSGQFKARRAFTRLHSFFLSYILLTSGIEKLELLSTQMSSWNLARAMAIGMVVLGLEAGMSFFVFQTRIEAVGTIGVIVFVLLFSFQLGLSAAGVAVAVSSYERLCSTSFALVYIIFNKAQSTDSTTVSPSINNAVAETPVCIYAPIS